MICAICKKPIDKNEPYVKHHRLKVVFHFAHNEWIVANEDLRTHAMQFFNIDKIIADMYYDHAQPNKPAAYKKIY